MQNRPKNQDNQTPNEPKKMGGCPACGMMSFPSKSGVFAQPKKEEPKQPSPEFSSESENSLGGCPACGMMSFTSNALRK